MKVAGIIIIAIVAIVQPSLGAPEKNVTILCQACDVITDLMNSVMDVDLAKLELTIGHLPRDGNVGKLLSAISEQIGSPVNLTKLPSGVLAIAVNDSARVAMVEGLSKLKGDILPSEMARVITLVLLDGVTCKNATATPKKDSVKLCKAADVISNLTNSVMDIDLDKLKSSLAHLPDKANVEKLLQVISKEIKAPVNLKEVPSEVLKLPVNASSRRSMVKRLSALKGDKLPSEIARAIASVLLKGISCNNDKKPKNTPAKPTK